MRFVLVTAVALCCISVSGSFAGGTQEAEATAGPGGPVDEVKIGTGWDATNPDDYSPWGMWEPGAVIFESLVSLDQDGEPIPCLAASWEISDDALTYRFPLQQGVRYHNGSSLEAADVVANFEAFKSTSWSKLVPYVEEIAAVDSLTVQFRLSRPHPLLLRELASVRYSIIAPEVLAEKDGSGGSERPSMGSGGMSGSKSSGTGGKPMGGSNGDDQESSGGMPSGMGDGKKSSGGMPPAMAAMMSGGPSFVVTQPVGTGPYVWDETAYRRNQSFSVVANENYWRGVPRIERLTWDVIPDPGARTMALEAGKIQMTGQSTNASITGENLLALKNNPQIAITMANNWGSRLLIMNHTRPPLDKVDVRKALRHGINYEEVQVVIGELATICPGPFGPDAPLQNPAINLPDYDPERARRMLADAGLVDTDGDGVREYMGKNVSLELISTKHPALSVLIQEQMKDIGIRIEIASKEQASQFEVLEQMAFDIASHSNIGSFSLDMYPQFSDSGDWSMHLGDPAIQALLEEYRVCTSYEQFRELSYEIQAAVHKKHVILFAVNERKVAAYDKDLGQFEFPPEEWVGALQEIWRM
jgi:ABC-type transport system substrate-binding protein